MSFIANLAPPVCYVAPIRTSISTRSAIHLTMAYADGQTAWQIFGSSSSTYFFLKKWFGGFSSKSRIDTWSREQLLSYEATQILRHGNAGPHQAVPKVDAKGFIGSKELAGFIGFRYMGATADEIVTACNEGVITGKQNDKRFVMERRSDDI